MSALDALGAADSTTQSPQLEPVVAYAYTGDYRIDTLIQGLDYRWNGNAALGSSVTVSYSFMSAIPTYGGTNMDGNVGFSPFTSQQRAAVREILSRLQTETGIRFNEVSDSATSYGQIRFGDNTQASSAGYAWLPGPATPLSGDVWIDDTYPQDLIDLSAGTSARATLIHEIGHALGLKHPGEYNAGSLSSPSTGNYLGVVEDSTNYTIMSYHDAAGGQNRDWFGIYDLLALRKFYGAGSPNTGDTVYRYDDGDGELLNIVNDASGSDTLDFSACLSAVVVDLRPGGFSSIGLNGGTAAFSNLSIDLTTTIEAVVGTAGNDIVTGNSINNVFTLGNGTNTVDGDAGIDTSSYAGTRASFQASASGSAVRVTSANVNDTLTNVERLAFSDGKLAFDLSGNAGITAKILGAVLGKNSVPIQHYVGIGLSLLDNGMSYLDLVDYALDATLGSNASHSAVVSLLYANLFGSAPGVQDLNYFTGLLDIGSYTAASMGVLAADSMQNQVNVNLVGLAAAGLAFV